MVDAQNALRRWTLKVDADFLEKRWFIACYIITFLHIQDATGDKFMDDIFPVIHLKPMNKIRAIFLSIGALGAHAYATDKIGLSLIQAQARRCKYLPLNSAHCVPFQIES